MFNRQTSNATTVYLSSNRFPNKPQKIVKKYLLSLVLTSLTFNLQAAELNTRLPAEKDGNFIALITVDMPAQPLNISLKQFSASSGLDISFDSELARNKKAPAIKGTMSRKEVLQRLLAGTGLSATIDGDGAIVKKTPENKAEAIQLDQVQVRAKRFYEIGTLPGLGLTKEEIPGNVQSITAKEIKESHALSLSDLMNSKLQSVNVNDYQSNPFQMDVTYRGFTASPQIGTAQGLSVFLDGIRVNEPFGDVVNWDMIPLNALNGLDVFPGSNPIFGLGTLGGALSMRTKSGFDAEEGTVEALGGSFKRKQFQGSIGGNNGVIAGFAAANIFTEDGWRDNSPSEVNQLFGKAEWRNESLQLGLSALYAGNKLVGNGLLPTEIAKQDSSQIFTSPDETKNHLLQFQLSGIWDVSDTFNISAQIYKRKSKRNSSTGDVNQDFGGSATRRPAAGEKPGYFAVDLDNNGLPDLDPTTIQISNVAVATIFDIDGNPTTTSLDTQGNTEFTGFVNEVILDEFGNPFLDQDGNLQYQPVAVVNPLFNGNLAVGTNANAALFANQATETVTDINGNIITRPAWTINPTPSGAVPDFDPVFYQKALAIWNAVDQSADEFNKKVELSNLGLTYDPESGSAVYLDVNGFSVYGQGIYIDRNLDANGNYILEGFSGVSKGLGGPIGLMARDPNGNVYMRDGADCSAAVLVFFPNCNKGYVEGTPVALVTETAIDQVTDGGAVQFNWNTEQHKFMVGLSIDAAGASYQSGQRLGIFDDKRHVILDPNKVGYEFAAATQSLGLNDFAGKSTTKSIYASETWTPTEEWAFNTSARYNQTKINNELAISNILGLSGANQFKNFYDIINLCQDLNGNGTIEFESSECPTGFRPFTYELAQGLGAIGKGEVEKFSYYSFNPSLGATWQANENLNLYGNWNKGARTPTVVELGCAYDDTPVRVGVDSAGNPTYGPRSLIENRFCSLPTTLSGDPYLKQVRSETLEFGARGYLTPEIQWNASVYNTDLTDDIYFVSFRPERSFFQNIGNTRRRGLEMGLQGRQGKLGFRLNYSLTDATFQDNFKLASPNNSSAGNVSERFFATGNFTSNGYQNIAVKPGDRIPGIPLHNLNATLTYDVTPDWTVGLTTIMHSESFVRGNENNKHRAGVQSSLYGCFPNQGATITVIDGISYGNSTCQSKTDLTKSRFPGKVPGYAVFNFTTSYKITKGLTAGLMINNLLDREYYSAGRLGVNPFSPSINGTIGPGGFNYNSRDWLTSTFLAPGAPRSAFFSLTYDFNPSGK